MVTLEDIEAEVAGSLLIRRAMSRVIKELNKAVTYYKNKYGNERGVRLAKEVILNKRPLNNDEFGAALKKFGHEAVEPLRRIGMLNKAQKQYIFKQMGWDINEVE
jgi:hypothetical protein